MHHYFYIIRLGEVRDLWETASTDTISKWVYKDLQFSISYEILSLLPELQAPVAQYLSSQLDHQNSSATN